MKFMTRVAIVATGLLAAGPWNGGATLQAADGRGEIGERLERLERRLEQIAGQQEQALRQMRGQSERLEQRFNQMAERREQFLRQGGGPGPRPSAPSPKMQAAPPDARPAPGPGPQTQMRRPLRAEGGPPAPPFPPGGHRPLRLFLAVWLLCNILLATWISSDIRKRGEGPGILVAVALLAGVPAAIIYALVRLGDQKAKG